MSNIELILPLISLGITFIFLYIALKVRPKYTYSQKNKQDKEIIEEAGDEGMFLFFLHLGFIFMNVTLYSTFLMTKILEINELTQFTKSLFVGFVGVFTGFDTIFWFLYLSNKFAKATGAYENEN